MSMAFLANLLNESKNFDPSQDFFWRENGLYAARRLLSIVWLCTAISRKVVGKSARDNPEGYCGFSSLFFKEISKNVKRGYGRMFASAKEKQ